MLRARAPTDDVRFPAWLQAADLEGLYAMADAFVFPSLYEGFGLPVLEAMARGVPVATSSRASLGEVAGDAALLFDPESVDAIRDALRRLMDDGALRERLRSRVASGPPPSPGRTAEQTFAAYERVLAALGSGAERGAARAPRQGERGFLSARTARTRVRPAQVGSAAAVPGDDPLERRVQRQLVRVAGEPVRGRLAQRAPPVDADDRVGEVLPRSADAATTPLTPSSTSSTAALSGARTTTLGTPDDAASTTTIPYPSRRDGSTMHSAPARAACSSSASTKPGARTGRVGPERGDRLVHGGPLGPVTVDDAGAGPRRARRRARSRAPTRAPASPG